VQDNLGAACHDQGRADLTVVHCKRALRLKAPAAGASPWTLAVCDALIDLIGLPAIYPDDAAVAAARGNFAAALDRLNALVAERPATSAAEEGLIAECLFKLNHFLLGYQQQDDKSLLQSYCAIAVELLKPRFGRFLGPVRRRPGGGKIRLGLASELLMNHNGVNWAYPWFAGLPRGDYEFFFYSLNGRADWLTEKFAALGAYRWLAFRPESYAKSLAAIRADELDVLVFPDVGMTASSRIASLARLAPIQCAGWGHPVTTGSPAIDYYLGSGAMEPPDAQDHYSETLVRLPGASVYVHDHDQGGAKAAREAYGLPPGKLLFGSVQNLLKYLPRDDDLYARIAVAAPDSLFVFIASGAAHVTGLFSSRMRGAFARRGIDFDRRAKILPRQPHAAFAGLFDVLDVNLDTPGWNGANTTVLALQRGCPTVTMPGEFMRGRHGVALLDRAGMGEMAAPSPDGYVALAARLATDDAYRARMSAAARDGAAALADNRECCSFLDAFFKEKTAALG
jgi:predicted O-linked N-acetylglucosamine transferase (SPINDLY family)